MTNKAEVEAKKKRESVLDALASDFGIQPSEKEFPVRDVQVGDYVRMRSGILVGPLEYTERDNPWPFVGPEKGGGRLRSFNRTGAYFNTLGDLSETDACTIEDEKERILAIPTVMSVKKEP